MGAHHHMSLPHPTILLLGVVFACVLTNLVRERYQHTRNLKKIDLRILVNGSRGKSSTTRLIRAALSAGDPDGVAAKTTGSAARFIAPSGRETPIIRKNKIVNVIEQLHVVARAVVFEVKTFVVECMAVAPDLQQLNTEVFVMPHVVVITNAREDHLDEMGGPDRDVIGVARSLCRSMPINGVCITAETVPEIFQVMKEEADKRGTVLIWADPDSVTDAEMRHFPWICFPDNVAIALVLAERQGISREKALAAMYRAEPDPGVLRVDPVKHRGKQFNAVNLFAANDPQSTLQNLALLRKRGLVTGGVSLVINCRPDRVERNGQMGSIAEQADPQLIFLIGHPTKSAADFVAPHLRERIVNLEGDTFDGDDLIEAISSHLPDDPEHAIVMVGNIHMAGEKLLHALHTAAYAGPTLDEELIQLTGNKTRLIPTAGIDQTLVWADEGEATVIPDFTDHLAHNVAYQKTTELRPVTPRTQQHDGPRPSDAATEQITLLDIRGKGDTRRLTLRNTGEHQQSGPRS